jgi:hypothetical protein
MYIFWVRQMVENFSVAHYFMACPVYGMSWMFGGLPDVLVTTPSNGFG